MHGDDPHEAQARVLTCSAPHCHGFLLSSAPPRATGGSFACDRVFVRCGAVFALRLFVARELDLLMLQRRQLKREARSTGLSALSLIDGRPARGCSAVLR